MHSENAIVDSFSIFRVSNEYFAIKAESVVEIMMVPHVTPVPKGADYLKGLFNHRGRILSLLESSVRLNLPSIEIGEKTPLMVVHYSDEKKEVEFGVIVDEVIEVIELASENIREYPSLEFSYDNSFIKGIIKYHDLQVTLLDIKNTFGIR